MTSIDRHEIQIQFNDHKSPLKTESEMEFKNQGHQFPSKSLASLACKDQVVDVQSFSNEGLIKRKRKSTFQTPEMNPSVFKLKGTENTPAAISNKISEKSAVLQQAINTYRCKTHRTGTHGMPYDGTIESQTPA